MVDIKKSQKLSELINKKESEIIKELGWNEQKEEWYNLGLFDVEKFEKYCKHVLKSSFLKRDGGESNE